MKFPLVVFDLDGTLIDSLADLADSMNAVLARSGLPVHPMDSYRRFVGDGVHNLVRRALPDDRKSEEDIRRHLDDMRAEYGRRWLDKTRPYPGINDLLAALAARGVKTAVLSNKPHPATEHVTRALFPRHAFSLVRGAVPELPVKPDPAGAFHITKTLGVPAAQTLYVGDTDTDMKTGRAAGYTVVGVAWGFRPVEELVANGAHHIVQTPAELLALAT